MPEHARSPLIRLYHTVENREALGYAQDQLLTTFPEFAGDVDRLPEYCEQALTVIPRPAILKACRDRNGYVTSMELVAKRLQESLDFTQHSAFTVNTFELQGWLLPKTDVYFVGLIFGAPQIEREYRLGTRAIDAVTGRSNCWYKEPSRLALVQTTPEVARRLDGKRFEHTTKLNFSRLKITPKEFDPTLRSRYRYDSQP